MREGGRHGSALERGIARRERERERVFVLRGERVFRDKDTPFLPSHTHEYEHTDRQVVSEKNKGCFEREREVVSREREREVVSRERERERSFRERERGRFERERSFRERERGRFERERSFRERERSFREREVVSREREVVSRERERERERERDAVHLPLHFRQRMARAIQYDTSASRCVLYWPNPSAEIARRRWTQREA